MADSRDNYWLRMANRNLSRRRVVALAGSGLAAVALASCGGDDDDEPAGGNGGNGGGGSTVTATATSGGNGGSAGPAPSWLEMPVGKAGGKATVALVLEPGTLDAHTPGSGGDAPYLNTMYNALVSLDLLKVSPAVGLAEKWEVADQTTINFTLRKGIKFHDGTDFNAAAVKKNIERIIDPATKGTWASQLAAVDRVETPDDLTARFILKKPDAALLFALSSVYGAAMISPAALDKFGSDIKSNPVGTGPFVFDKWIQGTGVNVKKNPNYWEKDTAGTALPYLDEIMLSAIPDSTVRYANLQTGDATFGSVDSKDIAPAEANSDLVVVKGVPGAGIPSLFGYAFKTGPMANANLRKAIAWAVDPSVVAKNVYFNLAVPAEGAMTTPDSWAYSPVKDRPRYDPKRAKEFLAAGGMPDGFEMEVLTYTSPSINQQTEIYQEQWRQIGIKTTVTTQEVSTAVASFYNPETKFPLMSTSWGGTSVEPSTAPTIAYASTGFYNPAKAEAAPGLDAKLAKAREVYDEEERKALYEEIDRIVAAEECTFLPMLYSQPRGIYRKNVGNTESFYYGGFNRLQHIFLKS